MATTSARARSLQLALEERLAELAICRRENESLKRRLEDEAAQREKSEAQLVTKGEAVAFDLRAAEKLAALRLSSSAATVAAASEHSALTKTIQQLQAEQAALQRKHGAFPHMCVRRVSVPHVADEPG